VPRLAAQNAQIRSSVSIIDIEQTAEHNGGYASAVAVTTGLIRRRSPDSLACGNAAGTPRSANRSHVPQPRTDWVAAMITPTTVVVVLSGASCPVDGVHWPC
jgi:hypothetical protein